MIIRALVSCQLIFLLEDLPHVTLKVTRRDYNLDNRKGENLSYENETEVFR